MGILQLTRVLHVVIATHFWGYRSKSGISVSEITLGIAGMPNRIADNFNGVQPDRIIAAAASSSLSITLVWFGIFESGYTID